MPTKHQYAYGIEEKGSGKIVKVTMTRKEAREYMKPTNLEIVAKVFGIDRKTKITVVELRKTKKKA